MYRREKIAAICFLWGVVVVAAYLAVRPRPTFFQLSFTVSTAAAAQDGVLSVNPRSNVPALQSWYVILHQVTGISFQSLNSIPLGVIGRMLIAAAIVWRLLDDLVAAALMSLAVGANSWASWGFNSIFVHSLGGILVLTTGLLLAIRYDLPDDQNATSVALLIVAAGAWGVDYTSLAWIGAAMAVVVGVDIIRSNKFTTISSRGSALALLIIAGVLGMTKNTIISAIGLSIFTPSESSGSGGFAYTSQESFFTFSKVYYYTIVLALALYGAFKVYQSIKNRGVELTEREQLLGVLSFASATVLTLYLLLGRFQQFFIFLLGPLIGVIAIAVLSEQGQSRQFMSAARKYSVTLFLVVLAVSAAGGFATAPSELSPTSETNTERAGYWLTEYRDDTTVMTDLTSQARLRAGAFQAGDLQDIELLDYNPDRYGSLISGRQVEAEVVVVDYAAENGVGAPGWTRFESLSNHRAGIEANRNVNAVYSNGHVTTYIRS